MQRPFFGHFNFGESNFGLSNDNRHQIEDSLAERACLEAETYAWAQAKERQRESQKNFHGNQHTSGMGQISAPHQKSKTSDDIAKIAGVSNNLSVWSKFPLPFRL